MANIQFAQIHGPCLDDEGYNRHNNTSPPHFGQCPQPHLKKQVPAQPPAPGQRPAVLAEPLLGVIYKGKSRRRMK